MTEQLNRKSIDTSHTTPTRTLESDVNRLVSTKARKYALLGGLAATGIGLVAGSLMGHANSESLADTHSVDKSVTLENVTPENTIDTFTLLQDTSIIGSALEAARHHHIDLDTTQNGVNENLQGITLTSNEIAKQYPNVAQPGNIFTLIESDPDGDGIKSTAVAYEPPTK